MRLTGKGEEFARLLKEVDDTSYLEPIEIIVLELYKKGGVSSIRNPTLSSIFSKYSIGTIEAMDLIDKLVNNEFAEYSP